MSNDNEMPTVDGSTLDMNGDVQAMFNLSDWMRDVLTKQGAKITGTGYGLGASDIWFLHNGAEFYLSLKPVMKK